LAISGLVFTTVHTGGRRTNPSTWPYQDLYLQQGIQADVKQTPVLGHVDVFENFTTLQMQF